MKTAKKMRVKKSTRNANKWMNAQKCDKKPQQKASKKSNIYV